MVTLQRKLVWKSFPEIPTAFRNVQWRERCALQLLIQSKGELYQG